MCQVSLKNGDAEGNMVCHKLSWSTVEPHYNGLVGAKGCLF
jgi:hypothetical protein